MNCHMYIKGKMMDFDHVAMFSVVHNVCSHSRV